MFECEINDQTKNCIVPIAEMFNTSSSPKADWNYDSKAGGLMITATDDINKEEEIFIPYNEPQDNFDNFFTYGFVSNEVGQE